MAFHRLVVPSYFGGLPGGYDYINTPTDPTVGGTGAPASMDGKKAGGPNDGTYMQAFGEDATSNFVNRPIKALAENTDILDNLMRRDLAITEQTANVLAASPVSSIVIAAQVFVGEFGVSNNQATRDLLVSVLDINGNEIITTAGVTVKALLIHDGSSTNVVGTQTSGFFSTPTVNLNVAIPAGVTYHVLYGVRTNLATMPKDAFTNIKIRSAQEVSGEVERVLRDLHAVTGATWNDPWLATINSLARTGLDGRYRLASTADPGSGTAMDTPGNGGFILRDGPSVKLRAPLYRIDEAGTVGVSNYVDPMFGFFKLEHTFLEIATGWDIRFFGGVGIHQESPYHNTADANEVAYDHVTGPLLLEVIPRKVTANTIAGGTVLTRINSATVATVNPDALTDATSRRTIQVGGSDFFKDGSGRTALRQSDFIEVTNNTTGIVVGTFRVDAILSASRITVHALSGKNPLLGPSGASAAVRLRWLQTTTSIGGTLRAASGGDQDTPHFLIAAPGVLHSTYDDNAVVPYAAFMASLSRRDIGITNLNLLEAMAWGGFDLDGTLAYRGRLYGDGGIVVSGGKQRFGMISRLQQIFNIANGGGAVSWNPLEGGQVTIGPTSVWTTDPSPITFAIDTTKGYIAEAGDEFSVTFIIPTSTPHVSVSWPGDFLFSDVDDAVLPLAVGTPVAETAIVRFKFRRVTGGGMPGGAKWLGERIDYSI